MPLTDFQREILATLASSHAPDSYLAGGAALHFAPNSLRYSHDLDFFHDSAERVATAFAEDTLLLEAAGYGLDLQLSQPGFIRAIVRRDDLATQIDWAHDSAWRFMPLVPDSLGGFLLHEVDLAINKTLALAGRDEPRDFVDIVFAHDRILSLGALTWAAVGKAVSARDEGSLPECIADALREALSWLAPDRAYRLPEEILDRIFASFCLGK